MKESEVDLTISKTNLSELILSKETYHGYVIGKILKTMSEMYLLFQATVNKAIKKTFFRFRRASD